MILNSLLTYSLKLLSLPVGSCRLQSPHGQHMSWYRCSSVDSMPSPCRLNAKSLEGRPKCARYAFHIQCSHHTAIYTGASQAGTGIVLHPF